VFFGTGPENSAVKLRKVRFAVDSLLERDGFEPSVPGHIRVLLRPRQLLADGFPSSSARAPFDLLLIRLEADGLFVGKEDLLSRVWPGIVVSDRFREVIRNGSAAGHRGLGFPDR
jgi:hypothetical protein